MGLDLVLLRVRSPRYQHHDRILSNVWAAEMRLLYRTEGTGSGVAYLLHEMPWQIVVLLATCLAVLLATCLVVLLATWLGGGEARVSAERKRTLRPRRRHPSTTAKPHDRCLAYYLARRKRSMGIG